MTDAKTVLEKPSRIKCACGHIAAEHGACCFVCSCEASMHEVMKVGYRDALAASEAKATRNRGFADFYRRKGLDFKAEAQVLRARVEALLEALKQVEQIVLSIPGFSSAGTGTGRADRIVQAARAAIANATASEPPGRELVDVPGQPGNFQWSKTASEPPGEVKP